MASRRASKRKQRQRVSAAAGRLSAPGADAAAEDAAAAGPSSIVVRRGRVSPSCRQLVRDWRLVVGPRVSVHLKETRKNKQKDFKRAASVLGVSHLQTLTQTDNGIYLKIAKLPKGPTLTFQASLNPKP